MLYGDIQKIVVILAGKSHILSHRVAKKNNALFYAITVKTTKVVNLFNEINKDIHGAEETTRFGGSATS
ncbi:hypothetical protein [Pseudodesulfovibrio methanolicus]|uniref:Uncharacterized protein n=1 Tax=Pseudodesulfovibrio methanolicus TaxID=3126690 RepID=A0ABZ2IWR6_9BACT